MAYLLVQIEQQSLPSLARLHQAFTYELLRAGNVKLVFLWRSILSTNYCRFLLEISGFCWLLAVFDGFSWLSTVISTTPKKVNHKNNVCLFVSVYMNLNEFICVHATLNDCGLKVLFLIHLYPL